MKKQFKIVMGVVSLTLIIGGLSEKIAENRTRSIFPPPGQLVNVRGHNLHVYVTGERNNDPTVLMESGQGAFSVGWTHIQDELTAAGYQVVSYDRPGYGWSEPVSDPLDIQSAAQEFRMALDHLGIAPPYVVVGHSLGGLFASSFAVQYADDVSGIVLVDPTPPTLYDNLPPSFLERMDATNSMMRWLQYASHVGVLRLFNPLGAMMDGLPQDKQSMILALSSNPDFMATYLSENRILSDMTDAMSSAIYASDHPRIILSTNQAPDGQDISDDMLLLIHGLHQEWAEQWHNGQWHIIDGANHFSIITNPQFASQVTERILEILD